MICKHCRRGFTTVGFYRQRYCSGKCRRLAENARYRRRYRTDATFRKKQQAEARAYYGWAVRCSSRAAA